MSDRWIVDDFSSALDQFESAMEQPASSDLIRAGCIQYFEFTFELAWKAIKQMAEEFGLPPCTSPKSCLKAAFHQGWIEDEAIWLDMLEARNQMSHTYDARNALKVYGRLAAYRPSLRQLLERLKAA